MNVKLNQKGQTFIEFMLLLIVIVTISLTITKLTNNKIADLWVFFANLIIDDPANSVQL